MHPSEVERLLREEMETSLARHSKSCEGAVFAQLWDLRKVLYLYFSHLGISTLPASVYSVEQLAFLVRNARPLSIASVYIKPNEPTEYAGRHVMVLSGVATHLDVVKAALARRPTTGLVMDVILKPFGAEALAKMHSILTRTPIELASVAYLDESERLLTAMIKDLPGPVVEVIL